MEEVEIVEEERESRGSEVNAERETEREKRKLCQAVGSEQFLCLSTVSCVSVCVFSSAVRWGYPLSTSLPPVAHLAELFACVFYRAALAFN